MLNTLESMDEDDRKILKGIIKDMSAAINATVKEYLAEQLDFNK